MSVDQLLAGVAPVGLDIRNRDAATSAMGSIAFRSYVHRGPMPTTPKVIFSPGATFPSAPRARAGSTVANEAAAVAAAVPSRKSRREGRIVWDMMGFLVLLEVGVSKYRLNYTP